MRVKVKRAGHEVARGHDRWHIDCVNAMTRPAGTRESMPGPTSDSLGSAWRRAGQRQELRDGRVFGVRQSSVCSRGLYPYKTDRKISFVSYHTRSISMNITRVEAWQLHEAVNTAKGNLCRHRDRIPTGGA